MHRRGVKTFGILILFVLSAAEFACAQRWTQTGAPARTWAAVASSADQSRLIAVSAMTGLSKGFYLSTNSGTTWTSLNSWYAGCVASSADGRFLVALSDKQVITSTDYGNTWHLKIPVRPIGNWVSVASSANGSNLVAATYEGFEPGLGGIFTSKDAGNTWVSNAVPPFGCYSVATSADGTILIAASAFGILISTNSATTWRTNMLLSGDSISVASSADGKKLVAAVYGGKIYTSTNSGAVWRTNTAPVANWEAVASSADGTKLVAGIFNGQIYSSTNSGTTWKTNNAPNNQWSSFAMSADGNQIAAATDGYLDTGGIWVTQSIPKPKLNFAFSGGQAALSWLIPSTNFGLQESTDMVSWTDVTNSPTLNLMTLRNEVTLSPSGSSDFYRLATP